MSEKKTIDAKINSVSWELAVLVFSRYIHGQSGVVKNRLMNRDQYTNRSIRKIQEEIKAECQRQVNKLLSVNPGVKE